MASLRELNGEFQKFLNIFFQSFIVFIFFIIFRYYKEYENFV